MRRSFKEHIMAHCLARGFPYHEHVGDPWFMNIGEEGKARVHIRMDGSLYVIETPEVLCTCVASAWDIACLVIDYYLSPKSHSENNSN